VQFRQPKAAGQRALRLQCSTSKKCTYIYIDENEKRKERWRKNPLTAPSKEGHNMVNTHLTALSH
jgi:hypothetical protein